MERITDAWQGLGRREQLLAIVAVSVLAVVLAVVVLLGGSEGVPIDGSETITAASDAAPVQPTPGMIVATPASQAPEPEGTPLPEVNGVAGLTVANGDEADVVGDDSDLKSLQAEADRNYVPDKVGQDFQPPVSSSAVKAAGRDLERVAAAYRACWEKAKKANADARHCINQSLKYGVYIASEMPRNGGIALTKLSSDGHRLDYILMAPPQADCRALDQGDSCDAWSSS